MVVCKCKKATKLYCFVHKAPVCGECICSPEHRICVVRTYSEWVIDGDYDWPPTCSICSQNLEEGDFPTTRLGCLHVYHTTCLERHLQSFPAHTAPAGYVCLTCSTPVWPPKAIKEPGSAFYNELKSTLSRSDVANILLGGGDSSTPRAVERSRLSAMSSPAHQGSPRSQTIPISPSVGSATGPGSISDMPKSPAPDRGEEASSTAFPSRLEGLAAAADEAEAAAAAGPTMSPSASSSVPAPSARQKGVHPQPMVGPTGRRNSFQKHSTIDIGEEEDDEDVERKYARRGNILHRLARLLPIWSTSGSLLPTANAGKDHPRADTADAEGLIAGQRRRGRRREGTGLDARRLLLLFAVVSCMGTMMLLYMRLATSLMPPATEAQP